MADRRRVPAERNRAALIEAGFSCLAEAGPDRLSLDAVARRAGLSRLTVYNRFGSRDGLLTALVEAALDQAEVGPLSIALSGGDLDHALSEAVRAWSLLQPIAQHLRGLPAWQTRLKQAVDVRNIVRKLSDEDRLRPGCSINEAEDIVALALSFDTFSRMSRGGTRPIPAVSATLRRIASLAISSPL